MTLAFRADFWKATEIHGDLCEWWVVGGKEENKNGGENIVVLEYSAQTHPRPLCAPPATSHCPTDSSGGHLGAGRAPLT